MNRSIIFIMFLTWSTSCRSEEGKSVSENKFIALAQARWAAKFSGFLIKKVHNPKITIDYGFSDNNRCSNQFSYRDEQQLKDSISKSLRVWLAPLAERGKIVNRFEYRYRKTHKAVVQLTRDERRKFKYTLWIFGNPDLSIIFYCQAGWSFAWPVTHAQIHMYQEIIVRKGVSDQKKYNLVTLHHEIGHALGLGDTYIDDNNTSDGGDAGTRGRQPISVMSVHYPAAIDSAGELQLGYDDIAGIKWLYKYHVAKTIDSKDCPAGYLYEDSTKGCSPRYPLIFAVKQNNFYVVSKLLIDDPTINLDQQDELGNSALHYAAKAHKMHGHDIYDYLIHKGANTQLKNNKGESAGDLLGAFRK